MNRRFFLLVSFWVWLVPSGAAAQSARLSLEAQRGATCAAFDQIGSSYRPYTCAPRCDCLPGAAIAAVGDCDETAEGTFSAYVDDAGTCNDSCLPFVAGSSAKYCTLASFDSCDPAGPPPRCADPLETCIDLVGGGQCVMPCASSAQCTGPPTTCDNSPIVACTSDSDCAAGSTCLPLVNTCARIPCTQDSECVLRLRDLTLTGVTGPDTTDPVTCSDQVLQQFPSTTVINVNDALECIAQIESVLGQACTPFAP